jgi:hypothetical protein
MSHLSASEFTELVEGTLPDGRARHVFQCENCRSQADAIRATFMATRGVEVPEPSPLFWDHLSARVRAGIESAPLPRARWSRRRVAVLSWSLAAMVLVALVVRQAPWQSSSDAHGSAAIADLRADSGEGTDPAWDLLVSAASDLQVDDAHAVGLGVRAASVDKALLELTPAEREELGRLLQEEMKHPGA